MRQTPGSKSAHGGDLFGIGVWKGFLRKGYTCFNSWYRRGWSGGEGAKGGFRLRAEVEGMLEKRHVACEPSICRNIEEGTATSSSARARFIKVILESS